MLFYLFFVSFLSVLLYKNKELIHTLLKKNVFLSELEVKSNRYELRYSYNGHIYTMALHKLNNKKVVDEDGDIVRSPYTGPFSDCFGHPEDLSLVSKTLDGCKLVDC